MATLIQVQEAAIAKLDVTRSSVLRYTKLRRSVYRWYAKQLAALGYTQRQANETWRDVRDMYDLRKCASE